VNSIGEEGVRNLGGGKGSYVLRKGKPGAGSGSDDGDAVRSTRSKPKR